MVSPAGQRGRFISQLCETGAHGFDAFRGDLIELTVVGDENPKKGSDSQSETRYVDDRPAVKSSQMSVEMGVKAAEFEIEVRSAVFLQKTPRIVEYRERSEQLIETHLTDNLAILLVTLTE